MSGTPIKYVAELKHVREVSLLGTADLDFWRDRLGPAGLFPAERDGSALVMVVAIESRFMGVPFREANVSVVLSGESGGTNRDGVYLVRAFNSSRFFAFIERACFASPYLHGSPRVAFNPASIDVSVGGDRVLTATMSAAALERNPLEAEDECWQGPVFLPTAPGKNGGTIKFFQARITGAVRTYPFVPSVDSVTIQPRDDEAALRSLLDSNFRGSQWGVRGDGSHAKGKTVERASAALAFARPAAPMT